MSERNESATPDVRNPASSPAEPALAAVRTLLYGPIDGRRAAIGLIRRHAEAPLRAGWDPSRQHPRAVLDDADVLALERALAVLWKLDRATHVTYAVRPDKPLTGYLSETVDTIAGLIALLRDRHDHRPIMLQVVTARADALPSRRGCSPLTEGGREGDGEENER